jgi:Tat protein secretion system quality control protein TatD with DNase activity
LKPIIIDVHSHLASDITTDLVISALNQGVVDAMVMFARNPSTDAEVLDLADALPGRVVVGLAFQQPDWMIQQPWVLQEIERKLETGRYHWLGEVILRHYGAPAIGALPWDIGVDTDLFRGVLTLATRYDVPVTIHHELDDGTREVFRNVLRDHTSAVVVWAHWCGRAAPDDAQEFLDEFPNLYCDLAASTLLTSFGSEKNPLFIDEDQWDPDWKNLIEAMPGRFLFGIDSVVAALFENYGKWLEDYQKMFALLSSDTRAQVMGGNAARLLPAEVVAGMAQVAGTEVIGSDPLTPSMTTEPIPALTIDCSLDEAEKRINCQASGYQEGMKLTWTSTASSKTRGGDWWNFNVSEGLIGTEATVFLEECEKGVCRTAQVVVDLASSG